MKVHHLVLAHRDPQQVVDLVTALHAPWTTTTVHVDARADLAPFATPEARERATFTDDRLRVQWGGWSMVEVVLRLFRSRLPELADEDYVVLLSGDSYPLAGQEVLARFLRAHAGEQFLSTVPFPADSMAKTVSRVRLFALETDRHRPSPLARAVNAARIPRDWRRAYGDYTPLCGSQWFTLTGAAVRWVLAEVERNPPFVRFSRHTRIPDEQFFHTLVGSSPYAARVRRNLMYVDFSRDHRTPAALDEEHLRAFEASEAMEFDNASYGRGPMLFARKVLSGPPDVAAQLRERVWPRWERLLPPDDVAAGGADGLPAGGAGGVQEGPRP